MLLRQCRRLELLATRTACRSISANAIASNKWARPQDLKPLPDGKAEIRDGGRRRQQQQPRDKRDTKREHTKANATATPNDATAKTPPPSSPTEDSSISSGKARNKFKNKSGRKSLLNAAEDGDDDPAPKTKNRRLQNQPPKNTKKDKSKQAASKPKVAKRQVFIPAFISVANLSRLFNLRLDRLQRTMIHAGMDNVQYDRVLTSEDASLLAMECGLEAVVNEDRAFDLYPR